MFYAIIFQMFPIYINKYCILRKRTKIKIFFDFFQITYFFFKTIKMLGQ